MNNYSPKQLIDDFISQVTSGATERLDHSQTRALLESLLRKLNLVSREEFDAQAAVLARTRKKLEYLETKVAELEVQVQQTD